MLQTTDMNTTINYDLPRQRYLSSSDDSNSMMNSSAGNSPSQIVPNIHNTSMSVYDIGPQLVITNQPVDKFRFRYESEMAATHGTLFGRDQQYSKKQSCPAVELRGYSGECTVTCMLIQNDTKSIRLHPHHLIARNNNDDLDTEGPVIVNLGPEDGYVAKFQGMSIVHTFKKKVANVLFEKCKKQNLCSPVIREFEGWKKSDTELMAECCNEAKNINLNSVRLCFFAHDMHNQPICRPVVSYSIDNIKSTETGTLRINRISKVCGSPYGDDEVFIFVEKVSKKNIKIRFFEEDVYGNRVWEAFAKFNELDVHHQYAIVFLTPSYRDREIQNDVVVFMELYRPKDEAVSERRTFRYKGQRIPPRKRKCNDQSYNDFSIVIPETISDFNLNKNDVSQQVTDENSEIAMLSSVELNTLMQNNLDDINTDLLNNAIGSIELEEYLNMFGNEEISSLHLLEADSSKQHGLKEDKTYSNNSSQSQCNILKAAKICNSLLIKSASSTSGFEKLLLKSFEERFDDGNNILHFLIKINNTKKVQLLLHKIKVVKMNKLLDETNEIGETILHTAIRYQQDKLIKSIIDAGANPNICDDNGNSPLHLSVMLRNLECLTQILNSGDKFTNLKLDIDKFNSDGSSALHLATISGLVSFVSRLIAAGANSELKSEKNGQTPLYLAVKYSYPPLVSYLVQYGKVEMNTTTFDGYTPLHAVCVTNDANSLSICKILINAGANINYKCNQGYPLDLAIKAENTKIVNLLRSHNAKSEVDTKESEMDECQGLDECTYNSLSRLLNEREIWKTIINSLEITEIMMVCLGSENPAQVLLDNIEVNENITWENLLQVLKQFNEIEPADVLSNFMTNLKNPYTNK